MQRYKFVTLLSLFPLLFNIHIGQSEKTIEDAPTIETLDEEFLLFLSEITINDNEIVDPLDMLEMDTKELNPQTNNTDVAKMKEDSPENSQQRNQEHNQEKSLLKESK